MMPSPLISKQPTSSVGPKRFLRVRINLRDVCRSPSKWQTTSTRCSRVRGPAMEPSLVTCPTSTRGVELSLATRIRLLATSLTWAGIPATPSRSRLETVWTESTIISSGSTWAICPSTLERSVSVARNRFSESAEVRVARSFTCEADSSAET